MVPEEQGGSTGGAHFFTCTGEEGGNITRGAGEVIARKTPR